MLDLDLSRAKRVAISMLLAGLAAGASTIAVAQDEKPKRGGTLVFGMGADANFTNRSMSSANPDGLVGCMIYEGLAEITGTGEIKPLLAKSWTISDDGRTYTFDLNKANWQDGKPFTSKDVKYTMTELAPRYSAGFRGAGRLIESVETPVDDKVIVKLKKPYGPFLISLNCQQGGAIFPEHIFAGTDPLKNPAATTTPIGTGPFKLGEWKRGDYIRMVRNPDYWSAGKPYLDEVIAKILPQASSRTQALMAGEIDFLSHLNLPLNDVPAVRANPSLAMKPAPIAPTVHYMFLNVKRPPLDNAKVRQALFMAIDRKYLTKVAFLGNGSEGTMPFTNRIKWAANPDVDYNKIYPFDPERADKLLDELGLKRGADGIRFKVKIIYTSDDSDSALVAQAAKSMWRKIGVDTEISPAESTVAGKMMYVDYVADVSMGTLNSFYDPAIGIARLFTTSGIGVVNANASNYSNPAVDELFLKGEQAATQEERGKYYKEVQAILAEELPALSLHEQSQFVAYTAKLMGHESESSLPSWREEWLAD